MKVLSDLPDRQQVILAHAADIGIGIKPVAEIQEIFPLCRVVHDPDQDLPGNRPAIGARAGQPDVPDAVSLQNNWLRRS